MCVCASKCQLAILQATMLEYLFFALFVAEAMEVGTSLGSRCWRKEAIVLSWDIVLQKWIVLKLMTRVQKSLKMKKSFSDLEDWAMSPMQNSR